MTNSHSAAPASPGSSIYLDNAATSFPKPDCVCDAVDLWMRNGSASHGRSFGRAATAAGSTVSQCRRQLADLLGIEAADHLAFTFNCTDSLNLLLRGILEPGDRVVTSTLEHNSVLRPLHQLQREISVDVALVDFDAATGMLDAADFAVAVTARPTRLVVISHASNVLGTIQPVADIVREAHSAGAMVLLDAAQTAGHVPLSMSQLNVDFLAAAGHKGLLGPTGTGILAIRPGLENLVRCVRSGGTGTASESLEQPLQLPGRFESGNMNMPGLVGLHAAVSWLTEQTIEVICGHTNRLCALLRDQLRQIPSVVCYPSEPSAASCGIVSFNLRDTDCREVAMILDQSFGITCRAGLHCAPLAHKTLDTGSLGGTLRLSPGPFTTEAQIATTVRAIQQIAAAY